MKIIQVCQKYYPDIGGIETHVKEISEMLVTRGFDVEVVCTDPTGKLPKKEIINGVKVTRFWALAPGEAYYFSPMIYFYLRNQEYDVIHAHNYHSFPALFAALARKNKFIFTPHTFGFSKSLIRKTLHKFYRPFGEYIFRSAHQIISTAKFEEKWLIETFKIPETKIIYIPLPINIANKKHHKEQAGSIKKIAYFGRLSKEKNIKILISAFKLIKKNRQDVGLFIAGDGPTRKDLEDLGKNVGNVNFLGRLSEIDLKKFLEDIDIFVLPSMFEVSPRSVIEAMSLGIPVVSTPVGELPQVFRDGKDCLFAMIDDPKDMAEKILWLMNNEKQAKEIALSGRSIVEKRYDINNVISDYIRIYEA
jgi:glycosyltransferase involved in cell wall biosynthesis